MFFSDIFALLVTLVIFSVIAYVIFSTNKAVNQALQDTKENLKSKGLHISSSGLSVKTDKVFDREDYMDATQRGFLRALNASSIHRAESNEKSTLAHNHEQPDKKHRSLFGRRK